VIIFPPTLGRGCAAPQGLRMHVVSTRTIWSGLRRAFGQAIASAGGGAFIIEQ